MAAIEEKEIITEKTEKVLQHLIQLDIDGTITGYDGFDDFETLNPKIEKVIKKLTRDGHVVCLSTGRNFHSAIPIYKKAELNTYLSSYNGAYIVDPTNKLVLPIVLVMPNRVVSSIFSEPIIKKFLLDALIDRDDLVTICSSEEDHYKKIFFRGNPYIKGTLTDLIKLLEGRDTLQFVMEFINDALILDKVFAILRKYRNSVTFYIEKKLIASKTGDKVLVVETSKTTIRVRNKNSSKARGVETVASFYNIPLERTFAFGDAVNDIEVIGLVGKGVATINSIDYLKSLAFDITSHEFKLNSDGVADYLNNYFGYK